MQVNKSVLSTWAPVWDCNCDGGDCNEMRLGRDKLLAFEFWIGVVAAAVGVGAVQQPLAEWPSCRTIAKGIKLVGVRVDSSNKFGPQYILMTNRAYVRRKYSAYCAIRFQR
jgi:hypothetical protein